MQETAPTGSARSVGSDNIALLIDKPRTQKCRANISTIVNNTTAI